MKRPAGRTPVAASLSRAPLIVLALGVALAAGCGEQRLNVLLVSVDTLRADHLGFHGRSPSFTPQLDALAARGEVFGRAFAPAPFTLPSVAALLTGKTPTSVGVTGNKAVLAEGVETLASRLRQHGYQTAAVVSNYLLNTKSGIDRGFDVFDRRLVRTRIPERSAAQTTDAAIAQLERLRSLGTPFLLWVHYMDPHVPYSPPAQLEARHLAAQERQPGAAITLPVVHDGRGGIPKFLADGDPRSTGFYLAQYAAEVEYVDSEIGRLLGTLAELGGDSDTIVVFAADHGESLGEDDLWFTHGHYLSDVLIRVPLVIRVPGRAPARREDIASLLDVVPTLLGQMGLPAEGLAGRDLLANGAVDQSSEVLLSNHRPEAPRTGLVSGGYKYVADRARGELVESVVRVDRVGVASLPAPEKLRAMRLRHRELEAAQRVVETRGQTLSDEELGHLRDLGYAE